MRLRLVCGCIARRSADAIVTSANPHLSGESNPSYWQFAGHRSADGALRATAGGSLLDELERLAGLPLSPGTVVVTSAGALDANLLVHAICPDRNYGGSGSGDDSPARLLQECYARALLAAEFAGASSVAMPAIGCGVRGWPPSLSAKIALKAFQDHAARKPSATNSLRLLEVVLLEPSVFNVWATTARAFSAQCNAAAGDQSGGLASGGGEELEVEIDNDSIHSTIITQNR